MGRKVLGADIDRTVSELVEDAHHIVGGEVATEERVANGVNVNHLRRSSECCTHRHARVAGRWRNDELHLLHCTERCNLCVHYTVERYTSADNEAIHIINQLFDVVQNPLLDNKLSSIGKVRLSLKGQLIAMEDTEILDESPPYSLM
jgi:hypothetical protein